MKRGAKELEKNDLIAAIAKYVKRMSARRKTQR
jgi:hypothetical protein